MREPEPYASRSSKPAAFFIGRDSHGSWVVQDDRGLRGGLFADRTQALRFALFENGNRPQAVVMVPGVFELDMRREAPGRGQAYLGDVDTPERKAA
jgi:hypothetical protein